MAKKEKVVNYTDEQTSALVSAYTEAKSDSDRVSVIETFAEDFGKSLASIRQKLVREGVYQKPEKAEAGKKGGVKKADLVTQIAAACNRSADAFDSLEKATFPVLTALRDTLIPAAKAAMDATENEEGETA